MSERRGPREGKAQGERTSDERGAPAGDARSRAAEVLLRVDRDGAYAAAALASALERAPALSPQDRGLCTELVYGVLRTAPALDAALERFARPGSMAAQDPLSRAVLRVAAYQLVALARVPKHAAVHAGVEGLKRARGPGLARFGNAVLRRLSEAVTTQPDEAARVALALQSVPAGVRAALAEGLGGEGEADAVLRALFGATPAQGLRVKGGDAGSVEALRARLGEEVPGATVRAGAVLAGALRYAGGALVTQTRAYREGLFAVQEEGAQCVAAAAGVRPGMRVLDACAGRGGKTSALAEALGGAGVLHAVELYPEKVARIEPELARLGLRAPGLEVRVAAADLTRGFGALEGALPAEGYDVVLLDAPCSGLGTLARRPDLLHRLRGAEAALAALAVGDESDEGELGAKARAPGGARSAKGAQDAQGAKGAAPSVRGERAVPLPELQRALLERVAPRVRVGGWLVYAVCTLTRAEGFAVVDEFLAAHPEFARREASAERVPNERLRGATVVLRPDRDETDGFVVQRLERVR